MSMTAKMGPLTGTCMFRPASLRLEGRTNDAKSATAINGRDKNEANRSKRRLAIRALNMAIAFRALPWASRKSPVEIPAHQEFLLDMITPNPAKIMCIAEHKIAVGNAANFVVNQETSLRQAFATHRGSRYFVRDGKILAESEFQSRNMASQMSYRRRKSCC